MIKNNKGQGMIEYMILVALIAVGTIGVVRVVGNNLAIQFENINRSMGAKTSGQLTLQNADSSQINKKDLSDFMSGSR